MSLLVLLLAASGAGVAAGATAVGIWLRRRARGTSPTVASAAAPAAGCSTGSSGAPLRAPSRCWQLGLGDVVQVEDETRWLCSGIELREGSELRCAAWLGGHDGSEGLVVCFPPPEARYLWLRLQPIEVPATPPLRLELDGRLLDRQVTHSATVRAVGKLPLALGTEGTVSWYLGPAGDAAFLLQTAAGCLSGVGHRLEETQLDRMGSSDPAEG